VNNLIKEQFQEAQKVLTDFLNNKQQLDNIETAAQVIAESIKADDKVISCGNGGSHCDAMHFAEELTGRSLEPPCSGSIV